ncbi:MAG: hypothetical protein K9M56_08780 [Victivallales bacterium]|nr:hypothetical protein [Victivallales bacterium]
MSENKFVDKCINFIDALYHKKEKLDLGGGEAAIEKQHARGKLTARERIYSLLDNDSFEEMDKFVKNRGGNFGLDKKEIPYDGVITGFGTIDAEKVAVFSQDFTVQAGSLGEMHAKKIMKLQDMAMKYGIPVIGINDSGGARIQEGVDALFGYGGIFLRNTHASGVIPQISIIAGPCAGGAVYSPAITDFTIMVKQTSQMFITGPAVVKAVTHENIDKESLGGAKIHNSVSGCAHFIAEDDEDALRIAKKILSYIPQSNMYKPKKVKHDSHWKMNKDIYTVVPDNTKKSFDVRDIIKLTFDKGSFFEVQEHYSKNMVIGFARIQGRTTGIIANQPKYLAGVLDINGSDKAARFIRFCDAFNIPIVTFVDTPGFLPGVGQEHGGIIRHGAKMLYAYSEASVPLISIVLRKSYGGAYIAMASQHLGADFVFAWPSAEIAVMGAEGAANIIFAREIKKSDNPEQTRQEKINEYSDKFSNPYVAAERGYIEDVIDPIDTRKVIIKSINMAEEKTEQRIPKRHGNIPL